MSRIVAFLRGINLGNRRVSGAELRRPFEELGLADVATFIASGNVIFDDPGDPRDTLEGRIEERIEAVLGFDSDTMIRGLEEVDELTQLDVIEEAEAGGLTVFVTFAKRRLPPSVHEAFRDLETPDDRFVVLDRDMLWLRRGGVSDSTIKMHHLDGAMGGIPATRRKVTTLRRLVKKFG